VAVGSAALGSSREALNRLDCHSLVAGILKITLRLCPRQRRHNSFNGRINWQY
jgi:hypothetical protein